jgi:tripartite-type tricarboxylate transporter receptor subunit TctC
MKLSCRLLVLLFTVCLSISSQAFADSWPTDTIRLIVPFAPGGGADICARLIAQKLAPLLGQSVIVDNRPGAGGVVGTGLAARAKPDGYTLLLSTVGPIAVAPHLYKTLQYKPIPDFAPVTLIANALNMLVVNPTLPVHSVSELITYARAHPDKISFGSSGYGQTDMLSGELFKSMTGIKITHVPYNGGVPAMLDLMGGQIQMIFATVSTAIGPIKDGKIRALAMTGTTRFKLLPDVPTIEEAGVKGFVVNNWYGISAPAGTPDAVVVRLNQEIRKILAMPDVQALLLNQGIEAVSDTPQQFADYIKSEDKKWGKVVSDAGIHME